MALGIMGALSHSSEIDSKTGKTVLKPRPAYVPVLGGLAILGSMYLYDKMSEPDPVDMDLQHIQEIMSLQQLHQPLDKLSSAREMASRNGVVGKFCEQ